MIHGFYFRFYRMTHCEWLSVLLAKMVYAVLFCKYLIERMICKKRIINDKHDKALQLISEIHTNIKGHISVNNPKIDNSVELSIIDFRYVTYLLYKIKMA